ncbi:DsbA family protein [Nocardiopsis algeriensis]|uniref:Protein-disulfide isomerase n=1 Tax=Nocardiopsis algeriensis TaxID=1478215 RepID=A0A841J1B7_9ACTN|nr:DsbA family protein [Nocardiopsis algeriensis]MBB6122131.1 protein-disulfide isomerase [Nocardiopsis algeriensis]
MPDRSGRPIAQVLMLAGAACAMLLLAFLFVRAEQLQNPSGESAGEPARTVSEDMRDAGEELARRQEGDPRAMGEVDAPVVMVVYSDYLCPFCGEWVRGVQPDLVDTYVADGLLRIEWREFPYLGDNSRTLALGAMAAAEQGAFWEYHDLVYNSPEDFTGSDTRLRADLEDVAEGLGLDAARFVRDMEGTAAEEAVEADFVEGQGMGISGTPAFLINGDPVLGAQPLEVFTASVDLALSDAEG